MEIIIRPERVAAHNITPYKFKKVDSEGYVEGETKVKVVPKDEAVIEEPSTKAPPPPPSQQSLAETSAPVETGEPSAEPADTAQPMPQVFPNAPAQSIPVAGSDANVSELYKKIDDMSSSVVKMEMRLEKQQEEFNEKIEEERERSLAEGIEKGKAEAQQMMETDLKNRIEQFVHSVSKIESAAKNYEEMLGSIEKELINVALDIAKEVIGKEVEENSGEIAKSLAGKLLDEVKEASETTIRVNPQDNDALKEGLVDNTKIKIESDTAVSPGGVIILSNVGNINGDIATRYEQVKKNTLENE